MMDGQTGVTQLQFLQLITWVKITINFRRNNINCLLFLLGQQAWYSEECAMNVVCAPSSGYGSAAIVTTDLTGTRGTSQTDCTSTFGGTSAAAPLAAGVISLILAANPSLGKKKKKLFKKAEF